MIGKILILRKKRIDNLKHFENTNLYALTQKYAK